MFPDSSIGKHFACGKAKCNYLISFDVAPYFNPLMHNVPKWSDTLKTFQHLLVKWIFM